MDLRYSVGVRAVYPLASGASVQRGQPLSVAPSGNVVQVMPAGTNLTFVGIALDSYTNAPAGTQVEVVREGVVSLPFTGSARRRTGWARCCIGTGARTPLRRLGTRRWVV
jgi:predicted RecA/RadA family phage recombinase